MKTIQRTIIRLLMATAITACGNATLPDEMQPEALLSVNFEQPDAWTRAATSVTLSAGVKFKVYAYNQATSITGSTAPLAEGEYKIAGNGSDIEAISGKSLKLYAGVYDFYFVSYNVADALPAVGTAPSSLISNLTNGTDFLYVALKDVGVRSTGSGQNTFTVKLKEPFSRLCSAMKISVKAKEGTHPVTPNSLAIKSIAVTSLSGSGTFTVGKGALNVTGTADHTFALNDFNTGATVTDACTSKTDYLLLPTDGSNQLHFAVTLTITYDKPASGGGTTSTTEDFLYNISLTKALLAGVRYEFAFTLTFYDHYLPGDLELDILPFVEVPPLDTDIVGD